MLELITREELKAKDTFSDHTIKEVEEKNGNYTFKSDGGWWFGGMTTKRNPTGIVPKVGQTVRMYPGGMGATVRGLDIDGVEVYYETTFDHEYSTRLQRYEDDMERVRELIETNNEIQQRINTLPKGFRARLDGFYARGGLMWRVKHEGYELFCCEEAMKIATHFKGHTEGISGWAKIAHEEAGKKELTVSDQHSGNTFGFSVRLAQVYLDDANLIPYYHGALDALVGCDGYSCWSSSNEAKERQETEPAPPSTH